MPSSPIDSGSRSIAARTRVPAKSALCVLALALVGGGVQVARADLLRSGDADSERVCPQLGPQFRDDGTLVHRTADLILEGEPVRLEFTPNVRVDDGIHMAHKSPALTWGPAGEIYAVYTEQVTHFNPEVVVFTRSDDQGDTWSVPGVLVNDTQPNAVVFPAMDVMDDGTILAAWCEMKFAPYNYEVRFARSSDGGHTWSPSVVVHPLNPDADFVRPSLLVAGGRILIAYWAESGYPDGYPLLVTSDDGGTSWSPPMQIGTAPGTCAGSAPCLAYDPVTGLVGMLMASADEQRILFYGSEDLGTSWRAPVQVNDAAAMSTDYPDLAAAGGTFHAVWFDNRYGQYDCDVFASHSSNGISWTPSVKVNDALSGNQYEPHVRADAQGNVHVCWMRNIPFGFEIDLYYSMSADNGASWLPASPRVNDVPSSIEPYVCWTSDLLCDGLGNAFIAWNDARTGRAYRHIFFSKSVDMSGVREGAGIPQPVAGADLGVRVLGHPGPAPRLVLSVPRSTEEVELRLCDATGRVVGRSWLGSLGDGRHDMAWAEAFGGARLSSGAYFLLARTEAGTQARRVILTE